VTTSAIRDNPATECNNVLAPCLKDLIGVHRRRPFSDRTQNVRSVNALLSYKPTGTARTGMIRSHSLPRYPPGTSTCGGTSCVRTSPSSVSPASSTPFTTSASNAFPCSSNSSTLSESARWIARPAALPVSRVRMPPYPRSGFSPEPVSSVRPPFSRRLSSCRRPSFSPPSFRSRLLLGRYPLTQLLGSSAPPSCPQFSPTSSDSSWFFLVAIRAVYHRLVIPSV